MKKILLVALMIVSLVCLLAISASAARVEDYEDTYTLVKSTNIQQIFRRYTDETNFNREWYTDTITVRFVDENGAEIDEVPLWEYDEEDGRYYSLIWYISEWSFVTEKADVTYNEVTTQRDKYISAVYTLSKARAVDLRFDTSYSENKSFTTSAVGYDYTLKISKPLWGIFYDVNNTPDDNTDDIKLQQSTGMGRDKNDYNCIGFDAQFEAIGNKIVVANFRDCTGDDFDADCTGNYGTKTTWYLATNLQCLYYHDEVKYLVSGTSSVYEYDIGDGVEVINCQILRDQKRVTNFTIPNSTIYLYSEAFRGSDLTTLRIGEGLIHAASNNAFLWTTGSDNVYISKNILTVFNGSIPALIANHGANIYFDGDLKDAENLMQKIIETDSNYNNKITLVDYLTTTTRGDTKNICLFYNYSRCDAFYRGEHIEADAVNGSACYLADCSRCIVEKKYVGSDDTHAFVTVYEYANGYTAAGQIVSTCQNANCVHSTKETAVTSPLDALFNDIEYSVAEEGFGICVKYNVNKDALAVYKNSGKSISFGVVAVMADKVEGNGPLANNGELTTQKNVIAADVTADNIRAVTLRISGDENAWKNNANRAI